MFRFDDPYGCKSSCQSNQYVFTHWPLSEAVMLWAFIFFLIIPLGINFITGIYDELVSDIIVKALALGQLMARYLSVALLIGFS